MLLREPFANLGGRTAVVSALRGVTGRTIFVEGGWHLK